ncbi:hypothetical protein Dsin_011694 [Dipteronia sinensis]|uniref:Reverse transcriptase domain-containing protein n=1 Tax=Dipteronia sinensis TaxID=43782 RepID=A0AAE0AHW9_9ROSI|nr:hypothetical protein Dsin_011694 [Dipteronia sinensis]
MIYHRVGPLRPASRNETFSLERPEAKKFTGVPSSTSSEAGICGIVESYFGDHFCSTMPSKDTLNRVLRCISHCLSPGKSTFLDADIAIDDIRKAVFAISPTKVPEPDGLPALFFQQFWHVIGEKISRVCLGVLNDGHDLEDINRTLVTLIPKAAYFRNAIVGFECLHALKYSKKGKKKRLLALKLDMSKAYDRVEWAFLEGMMSKLGFSSSWISRVMHYVTSVFFSFLVNSQIGRSAKPSRGLRQGDPLSPYHFLICEKGLSRLFMEAEGRRDIAGLRYSRGGLNLTHLCFADDSMILRGIVSLLRRFLSAMRWRLGK